MNAAAESNPVFFGLKLYELLTLVGVFLGPLVAVGITLWVERRRRQADSRTQVLRMLLNTRRMPADPAWTIAINLVPVEFNKVTPVMDAWRAYIESCRYHPSPENEEAALKLREAKQTKLIYQVMRSLGMDVSEKDVETDAYVADGFVNRDNLYLESLRAMASLAQSSQRSAAAAEAMARRIEAASE